MEEIKQRNVTMRKKSIQEKIIHVIGILVRVICKNKFFRCAYTKFNIESWTLDAKVKEIFFIVSN